MSESTATSVLRRKAQMGQEQFQARAMTAARALRITLAKVAEDEMGLALAAIGLTESRGPVEPILKALDDTMLLILLESPGRGPGAALVDSALAGAIVQQQTMGRVSEVRPNAPPRKPTRTDAALVAPLLDKLFERAGPLPDLASHVQMLSGLRFGADMASPRLLQMALEAAEYTHFSITVDVANGTRQGRIDLILPVPSAEADTPKVEACDTEPAATTLEPMVMSLNAQLRVALCRLRMPFSRLADLSPGDEIALPFGVMENAEVLTIAGRRVSSGKLGQIDGYRAVRLEPLPQRKAADGGDPAGPRALQPMRAANGSAVSVLEEPNFGDFANGPLGDLPGLSMDGVPDLPELPGFPDLPELPELPGETEGLPDLPELPDLPGDFGSDFGDLPDLPELPDFPMASQA